MEDVGVEVAVKVGAYTEIHPLMMEALMTKEDSLLSSAGSYCCPRSVVVAVDGTWRADF